ncbi:MAG: ATPase [Deltaproteobacteria bacterium]|jgi:vacuolar-type H+-ATPase subunit F/Vma7|nr:ATPase [Deltaproteobacteria bacterium]MBW2522357.1 ATPase [Deltaproteobacteria bacterium]
MSKRVIFFTAGDAMPGFRLAGLEQYSCKKAELEELLLQFVAGREFGLYVIDERLITEDTEATLREMERGLDLVFVIMPPPTRLEEQKEDYALRLLRRAIGYHIQLNV